MWTIYTHIIVRFEKFQLNSELIDASISKVCKVSALLAIQSDFVNNHPIDIFERECFWAICLCECSNWRIFPGYIFFEKDLFLCNLYIIGTENKPQIQESLFESKLFSKLLCIQNFRSKTGKFEFCDKITLSQVQL